MTERNGRFTVPAPKTKRVDNIVREARVSADLSWATVARVGTAVLFAGALGAAFVEWISGPRLREDMRPIIRDEASRAAQALVDQRFTMLRRELDLKYDELLRAIRDMKDK